MALDKITYAAAKKYVDKSIAGGGISAGKNCTIDNISPITGGNRVTFKWTLDDGTVQTNYMDVMNGDKGETGDAGLGIKAVNINTQNHLIITFDDDTTYDAGELPGGSGEVISVNGKKGVVTLDANDVGALPDDTELFSGDYNDLNNLPDLTNFITNTVDNLIYYYKKTETYTKTEVDGIVEAIKNSRFEVVATLPATDIKTNVIYLVPKPTTQTQNVKDEYINLDGTTAGWEKIGDTEIDLSGYVKTSDLNTALAAYTTTTNLTALLADKVDKVTGKGLSTNDYTNADKAIVDGVTDALADKADKDDLTNLAPISLVKDTVGWTGKNLLKRTSNPNPIVENVTFTVNADNSITCNGTASGGLVWVIESVLCKANEEYILTGCPSGGGSESTNYWLGAYVNGTISKRDTGNGVTLKYTTDTTVEVRLRIPSGYAASNFTFYPMIRRADILDDTYEPYHESAETMYEEEIHGINLLKEIFPAQTTNGITWTVNDDRTVIANGTADPQHSQIGITFTFNETFNALFSGCPAGGGALASPKYDIYMWDVAENARAKKWDGETAVDSDYGNTDQEVLIVAGRAYTMTLRVFTGQTVSNLTFKPMLRKAEIEDSTYRPYNHQAIQNQINDKGVLGAKNLLRLNAGHGEGAFNGLTITYSRNSDNSIKSVVFNGTSTQSAGGNFYQLAQRVNSNPIKLTPNTAYIFSIGNTNENVTLQVGFTKNNAYQLVKEAPYNTNSLEFVAPDDCEGAGWTIQLIKKVGSLVLDNWTIYPMLRLASDPDDTYQPYAMTNRELMEKKIDAELTFVTGVSIDTLTENKRYYCSGGMTGLPTGNIGYLDVHRARNGEGIHQTFYPAGTQGEIYVRRYWDNAWGSWYKFTGTVIS